jgi:ubiquinone/menaquinone biosynthesis C-methylase UbiE
MATVSQAYPSPFDAVAEEYDRKFTESQIGRAQRASVWKELAKTFRSGDRILEIGCGTGVDACFLANRGVRVFACDNSRAMIEVANRRITQANKSSFVHLRTLAAEDLARLGGEPCFDGTFSNFGALNCVEDLRGVAINLARLLRPGATAMLCMMGRHCAWELAWYLAHGNPQKAFRRISRGKIIARLAPEATVRVHYPSVNSVIRLFSPEFRLKAWKGIGITIPPSYLESVVNRYPWRVRWMMRADSLFENTPIARGLADHVLLTFERVMEGGDFQ